MLSLASYPRFVPNDAEQLFTHWLQFDQLHKGMNLKETCTFCDKCFLFKDCVDLGVMKQLNCILETWEKRFRGSDVSSLLLGYMTEEEAIRIYKSTKALKFDKEHYEAIGKMRITEMFDLYFNSILHRDVLEISPEIGHYLPFIIHCVVQFKTLAVRYNELVMNMSENCYYMVVFVLTCFHLNGILAFSPGVVQSMWSELFLESVIAWFYNHRNV